MAQGVVNVSDSAPNVSGADGRFGAAFGGGINFPGANTANPLQPNWLLLGIVVLVGLLIVKRKV